MDQVPAQLWPITINENMYAENITKLSAAYGIPELSFQHPLQSEIFGSVTLQRQYHKRGADGNGGRSKTWLCYRLWQKFGGTYRNWTKDSLIGR